MNTVDAILSRASTPQLGLPLPAADILDEAFRCALRAPDHRMLRPWRFLTVSGAALEKLGEVFVEAQRASNPALSPEEEQKARQMPLRAPMIVVAITRLIEDPKVPRDELLLSTGAAVQNFQLALHDRGFGTMWRTGPLAENEHVRQALGLQGDELIAGFVYLGTVLAPKKINAPELQAHVCNWA